MAQATECTAAFTNIPHPRRKHSPPPLNLTDSSLRRRQSAGRRGRPGRRRRGTPNAVGAVVADTVVVRGEAVPAGQAHRPASGRRHSTLHLLRGGPSAEPAPASALRRQQPRLRPSMPACWNLVHQRRTAPFITGRIPPPRRRALIPARLGTPVGDRRSYQVPTPQGVVADRCYRH